MKVPYDESKRWSPDFDIYCPMTDAEVKEYTNKLRAAILANGGNGDAVWDFDSFERRISLWSDGNGDTATLSKLFDELEDRECFFEVPEHD